MAAATARRLELGPEFVESQPDDGASQPEHLTPDQARSRRKRAVRAATVAMGRVSQMALRAEREREPDDGKRRLPLTRGDCLDGPRPCPFVSCRHHLLLDVHPNTGNLQVVFPDVFDPDGTPRLEEMPETCSLDVADLGGSTLEEVGEAMNVTRERVRQIEEKVLKRGALRCIDPEAA